MLTELLQQIRRISGDAKFETLKPMREIFGLAGQAIDRAKEELQAEGQRPKAQGLKQLVVIETPQKLDPEMFSRYASVIEAKLEACGIAHEILILDGGTTLTTLEGTAADETDPIGPVPETPADPDSAGRARGLDDSQRG